MLKPKHTFEFTSTPELQFKVKQWGLLLLAFGAGGVFFIIKYIIKEEIG